MTETTKQTAHVDSTLAWQWVRLEQALRVQCAWLEQQVKMYKPESKTSLAPVLITSGDGQNVVGTEEGARLESVWKAQSVKATPDGGTFWDERTKDLWTIKYPLNTGPHGVYVMFCCGTVVRVDPERDAQFKGYGTSTYKFPSHRVSEDDDAVTEYMNGNVQRWKTQQSHVPVRCAYERLISDGYPMPGTEASDSVLKPLWTADSSELLHGAWVCEWPNRSLHVWNIATRCANEYEANGLARDLRRYDYMTPSAYAIIQCDAKDGKMNVMYVGKQVPLLKKDDDQKGKIAVPSKSSVPFVSFTDSAHLLMKSMFEQ